MVEHSPQILESEKKATTTIYATEVLFCFEFQLLRAQPYLFALLITNEEHKKGGYDVMFTSVTHAGLVHDVADTDSQTENGSAHSRVFATFKRGYLTK